MTPLSRSDLPTYDQLIYPTIRAVDTLGGSARAREITAQVFADIGATDEQIAVTYGDRPKSVLADRAQWARSYATMGGALERPERGLFVLTPSARRSSPSRRTKGWNGSGASIARCAIGQG